MVLVLKVSFSLSLCGEFKREGKFPFDAAKLKRIVEILRVMEGVQLLWEGPVFYEGLEFL